MISHRIRASLTVLAATSLSAMPCRAGRGPHLEQTDKSLTVAGARLKLRLSLTDGRWAAVALTNACSGRTIPLAGDDFAIGLEGRPPLSAKDFSFVGAERKVRPSGVPAGVRRPDRLKKIDVGLAHLTLRHENKALGLKLDIVYEARDPSDTLHRRLELSTEKPLAVRQVDVWRVKVKGKCTHQGYGEPVFLDDTFWGVEFPGADNRYADGEVRLSHFPGRTVRGRFVSKPAVVGAAKAGKVARRFRQYVECFQATPKARTIFVNYNTWWTLMPPTEANCLAVIDTFKRKLFDPHGQSFDTFTIDDGWDDKQTLWKLRADRFPNGFTPLIERLRAMKANLGLWLSPSSGYGHAPHLAKQGYEHNSNPRYCCQSGPKYRRDLVRRVTELARGHDVGLFKLDGFCAGCEAKGHGHLGGRYAREANIDAYIELMDAVRRARPGVYLDPTCGMWLSPWWLKHCDSIWGSVSGDYPDVVVPAPVLRDSATTTRDAVFRQRCREHLSFPPAAIEHLGIIVITPEKWEDNAMAVVGRGARLLTLYIDPKFFTKDEADWAFLASLLKWVRHNAELLHHTELIGGDPLKREAYGLAHVDSGLGIVSLRNPFIEPKTVEIDLKALRANDPPDLLMPIDSAVAIVYPRREVLRGCIRPKVTLGPYETLTLHFEPLGGRVVALAGIRAVETARNDRKLTYTVHGLAGRTYACRLFVYENAKRASIDVPGATVSVADNGEDLQVTFPGPLRQAAVDDARLEAKASGEAWELSGGCTANVPAKSQATMHVLCDPRPGRRGAVRCAARVNGKGVRVRAIGPPKRPTQAHKGHSWSWFSFEVPPGKSEVAITLSAADGGGLFRGEVGWWLWAKHPLIKGRLSVELGGPVRDARPEPLPIPVKTDYEDQVVPIQPPRRFRTGRRWPKPDQKVVWLDRAPPDEVSQGWGTLQRNRSVWSKPMVVSGRKFARGLGTHAPARIVYDLAGGRFRTFRCLVGRDAHADDGRIAFRVLVDRKKAFDSGPMTQSSAAKPVSVDVTGAAVLELLTLDGGDGISGDHGNWADAQLAR